MEMIAGRTGGKAFYNTNDIMGSVRRAIDDSEVSYTLGFYLSQDEMDSKFHELKVKVGRKGVDVRARKGFLAYKEAPPVKRDQVMREAVNSPLDATGITMAFRFDRSDQVKPGSVQVTAFIDAKPLALQLKDGRYQGAVQIALLQSGRRRSRSRDHRPDHQHEPHAGTLQGDPGARAGSEEDPEPQARSRLSAGGGLRSWLG